MPHTLTPARIRKAIEAATDAEKLVREFDSKVAGFGVKVRPNGSASFVLRYSAKGARRELSLGALDGEPTASDVKHYRAKADEQRKLIAIGADPVAERRELPTNMPAREAGEAFTLRAIFDAYLADLATHAPEKSIAQTKARLATFCRLPHAEHTFGETDARDLDVELMEDWREGMLVGRYLDRYGRELKRYSAHHCDKTGTAIKQALAHCTKTGGSVDASKPWRVVDVNPLEEWQPRKALKKLAKSLDKKTKRERFLTIEEQAKLRRALRDRDREVREGRAEYNAHQNARGYPLREDFGNSHYVDHVEPLIVLALNTGLRTGELLNLEWSRVDFDAGDVRIEKGKTEAAKRAVKLNREARAVLEAWQGCAGDNGVRPGERWVFESVRKRDGEPGPVTSIKTVWRSLMKRTGIEEATPYCLRATFASNLLRGGVPVQKIARLLGHASVEITLDSYAFLTDADARDAVDVLDAMAQSNG